MSAAYCRKCSSVIEDGDIVCDDVSGLGVVQPYEDANNIPVLVSGGKTAICSEDSLTCMDCMDKEEQTQQ